MSALPDDKIWFISLNGKRHGPFTFAAVVAAAEQGVVGGDTKLWRLGWVKWHPAHKVVGLVEEPDDDEAQSPPGPRATEPASTEPASTEPASTEPVSTDSSATESSVSSSVSASSERSATEPAEAAPAAFDPPTATAPRPGFAPLHSADARATAGAPVAAALPVAASERPAAAGRPYAPEAIPTHAAQMDERATDRLTADELAAHEPAAHEPAAHELAAHELAAHELAAHELAADQLAADQLATDQPASGQLDQRTPPATGSFAGEPGAAWPTEPADAAVPPWLAHRPSDSLDFAAPARTSATFRAPGNPVAAPRAAPPGISVLSGAHPPATPTGSIPTGSIATVSISAASISSVSGPAASNARNSIPTMPIPAMALPSVVRLGPAQQPQEPVLAPRLEVSEVRPLRRRRRGLRRAALALLLILVVAGAGGWGAIEFGLVGPERVQRVTNYVEFRLLPKLAELVATVRGGAGPADGDAATTDNPSDRRMAADEPGSKPADSDSGRTAAASLDLQNLRSTPPGSDPAASASAPPAAAAPPAATGSALPPLVAALPSVMALGQTDPVAYDRFNQRFLARFKPGGPGDEVLSLARTTLHQSLKRQLASMPGDTLAEITRVYLGYMQGLQAADPESCVALSDEGKGARLQSNLARAFPELVARDMRVLTRAANAIGGGPAPLTADEARPYLDAIFSRLRLQPLRLDLLRNDKLLPTEFSPYCALVIAFYQAVLALPATQSTNLLRYLYASAAADPNDQALR